MVNLPKMISPELLVPRLGDQLVDMGLLSNEQLQQALAYQLNGMDKGQQLLLGQAIMELGFLDRATLDWAVTEQIMHLRTALEDANHNLELRVQQRTIELEEALRRLSESSQLKANIIANISHELRTPLTHVRGYLDLLYTESLGDLNSDQKKALGVPAIAASPAPAAGKVSVLAAVVISGLTSMTNITINLSDLFPLSAKKSFRSLKTDRWSILYNGVSGNE